MINITQRIGSEDEMLRILSDKIKNDIRVAMPGIITAFDSAEQTATVQPAIRERVADRNGTVSNVALPLLPDVPVIFPRTTGYITTLPVSVGDECLIIFNDMCIDATWSNGGIQNQIEKRRHDLSDAVCIPCLFSQAKRLTNYKTDAAWFGNEAGTQGISITQSEVNLIGTIKKNGVAL